MEHYYEVSVDWNKDRRGTLQSSELENSIEVATPTPVS